VSTQGKPWQVVRQSIQGLTSDMARHRSLELEMTPMGIGTAFPVAVPTPPTRVLAVRSPSGEVVVLGEDGIAVLKAFLEVIP
jgi:hypothetical protein